MISHRRGSEQDLVGELQGLSHDGHNAVQEGVNVDAEVEKEV